MKKEKNAKTGMTNSSNVFENVLDYFIHNESALLTRLQEDKKNATVKEEVLKKAREQFQILAVSGKELDEQVERFEEYIWGYYVLSPLIDDKDVSDIKCYSENHIRIKRLGKRCAAPEEIVFANKEDYKRFINMVAVKNQVNISTLNAIQTFTDEESSKDFILRCDICTEYINTSKKPMLQIRKMPKFKYTMEELIQKDVITPEQKEYLLEKIPNAKGIFVTGKGSAGKTSIINSMLEYIPEDKSGLIIQENSELFTLKHPDMLIQRIRRNNGENRIQYDLSELTKNGLLLDIDYFVLGEIKGKEAADFMQCSYTGYQCWASGHGQSELDGIYKLADNIKRSTGYEYRECLKLLTGMEVVLFMKNYQLQGIAEIKGYDRDRKDLIIKKVELPIPPERE